jgi:hypothetical protein
MIILCGLAATSTHGQRPDPEQILDIESIRPKGTNYEAVIPDTLDLARRAEYSLNILTRNVNPDKFYATVRAWFGTWFGPIRVEQEEGGNWDILPKNVRAIPYMRTMCGSSLNLDVEIEMMRAILNQTRDDGLIYYPADGFHHPKNTTLPWFNGLAVLAIMNWQQRDHDPAWNEWISLICRGLKTTPLFVEDRAYYPPECSRNPDGTWNWTLRHKPAFPYTPPEEPTFDQQGFEGCAKFEQAPAYRALVKNYLQQGDAESMDVALKLSRFVLKPSMWEDTSREGYPGYEHGMWAGHVHANLTNLHALLDLAIATDDAWLKQFVREGYDNAVRNGVIRMGWLPGWTLPVKYKRPPVTHTMDEPCGLGDWAVLAVKLTDAGLGDYWDDVDAIVRNHLSAHQFIDLDLMRASAGGGTEHDELLERNIGGFGSGYKAEARSMCQNCCTVNATFGFYYAWHGITRFDKGVATVNLFLNRASEWMDIDSYLPYEGDVILHNKKAHTAMVRIPSWVRDDRIEWFMNDRPAKTARAGRYRIVSGLKPGDTIRLEFPVQERVDTYHFLDDVPEGEPVPSTKHTITFRGSTIIDIAPREKKPGTYPMYMRDHFKAKKAPMRTATRFVAEEILPLQ